MKMLFDYTDNNYSGAHRSFMVRPEDIKHIRPVFIIGSKVF